MQAVIVRNGPNSDPDHFTSSGSTMFSFDIYNFPRHTAALCTLERKHKQFSVSKMGFNTE